MQLINHLTNMHATYPGLQIADIDFFSLETWLEWRQSNPAYASRQVLDAVIDHTGTYGLYEPISKRYFAPHQIQWDKENIRESGAAGGITSRVRAALYAMHSCLGDFQRPRLKIFATEGVTDLALLLRGQFPKFLGSEYTMDPMVAENLFPIPVEDLTKLSFKDASFEVVMTNEVLEHVPSIDQALEEMSRILKPGGWHIGTCPFRFMDSDPLVRTTLREGKLVHLLEAEWHGDPMGTGGSLVFEIPGWDILDRARRAGFSTAKWKFVHSLTFGIAAEFSGGVFVLCLQK